MTEVPADPRDRTCRSNIRATMTHFKRQRGEGLMVAKCLPSHLSLGEDFDLAGGTLTHCRIF